MRAQLWALQQGIPLPELPPQRIAVSLPAPDWPDGFAEALGWIEAGPVLLRLDIAERVAAELAWASRHGATRVARRPRLAPVDPPDLLPAALRRLGFRLFPAAAGRWPAGPARPAGAR